MSLQIATWIAAAVLLVLGLPFAWNGKPVASAAKSALRDNFLALVLFGAGSAWFLYKVLHLGPADFGNFRNMIFGVGLAVAIGSWFYLPDFLAVRGAAILMLLAASELLTAAFGLYEIPQRLFMVGIVYVGIALALYLGTMPYKLRDFFNWLFAAPMRPRILGGVVSAYGVLLLVVSFTYPA